PYAHPIIPLLLDFTSARQAMPDVSLPTATHYPGGEVRARWHLAKGITTFENFFGFRPSGCWASEGALSDATLHLLEEFDFTWTATGDSVLRNSLSHSDNQSTNTELTDASGSVHRAYRFDGAAPRCFFRD